MEKIISISEHHFKTAENDRCNFDGYIIVTDKQEIKFGIDNNDYCCEKFGYFVSNDDFNDFIGANIIDLKIVDDALNVSKLKNTYNGNVMFFNIETDRGVLQFTAYSAHNAFYSHNAIVVSEQLNYLRCLC